MTKTFTPSSKAFPWALAIFPLLELGFFAGSVAALQHSLWISLLCLLLACLSLSFGIHIFFHECVHRNTQYPLLFKWLASSLMGLPFDGYRIHHYNHHTFENGPEDFSSTWKSQGETKVPFSVWSYTLGWPRQLIASVKCKTPFGGSPESANRIKEKIPSQKLALLITLLLLAIAGWKFVLLYLALIYFGWAFTSLHNYGQHPPIEGEGSSTYVHSLYNILFFNNGLHWEHHRYPSVLWNEITAHANSPRITWPHILNALKPFNSKEISMSEEMIESSRKDNKSTKVLKLMGVITFFCTSLIGLGAITMFIACGNVNWNFNEASPQKPLKNASAKEEIHVKSTR